MDHVVFLAVVYVNGFARPVASTTGVLAAFMAYADLGISTGNTAAYVDSYYASPYLGDNQGEITICAGFHYDGITASAGTIDAAYGFYGVPPGAGTVQSIYYANCSTTGITGFSASCVDTSTDGLNINVGFDAGWGLRPGASSALTFHSYKFGNEITFDTSAGITASNLTITSKINTTNSTNWSSTLSYYSETSYTVTYSGIWASGSGSLTAYVTRVGDVVNIHFPIYIATAAHATVITVTGNVPSGFRPAVEMRCPFVVQDGGSFIVNGLLSIDSTGATVIAAANGSTFSGGGSSGVNDCCVTYNIN